MTKVVLVARKRVWAIEIIIFFVRKSRLKPKVWSLMDVEASPLKEIRNVFRGHF